MFRTEGSSVRKCAGAAPHINQPPAACRPVPRNANQAHNMFLDETQSANTQAANDSRLVVAGTTRSGDRYETIRFI